jgi:hypothetical protein
MAATLSGCVGSPTVTAQGVTANAPKNIDYDRAADAMFKAGITLSNDDITLIVNPALGRIVWFGRRGGDNLLWVDPLAQEKAAGQSAPAWRNWGGDKVWWGPQALWAGAVGWRWPPDTYIDGTAWRLVSHDQFSVEMESVVSPYIQSRIRRQIILSPDQPHVTLRQQIIRTEASPMPVCVWTVSQILAPDFCLLDIAPTQPNPKQPLALFDSKLPVQPRMMRNGERQYVRVTPADYQTMKIGTLGDWLAAVTGSDVFLQIAPYQSRQCYPELSSMQAYVCPWYVELETLSPMAFPQPQQSISHEVQWWLLLNDGVTKRLVERINAISDQRSVGLGPTGISPEQSEIQPR